MSKDTLELGVDLRLPIDAVTRTTAVVGQKGTGKTSTAVVTIEEAAAAGARFAVMDPTGAWSGLRSSASGDGAGLDCVVMGGFHGDVPLDPGAGEVVARLVVEEGYNVVCDLERMPRSDQVRFVADFSEAAYHLARSAVTVVYDEAPRFAPQGGAGLEEDGTRCRIAVTEVVMLGRRKGLGSVLISQRPSKLHKDVLEQADIMVAHRLMGVNDRKAIAGWLEDAADEPAAILERIPRLERGQAIVLAPEYSIAGVFNIRMKRTFDSSATPDVGAVILDAPRGRASIDLSALEQKMGHALEAAQENDPDALRRRVRKLEKQLSDGGTVQPGELAAAQARVAELETEVAQAWEQAGLAERIVDGVRAALAGKHVTDEGRSQTAQPAAPSAPHGDRVVPDAAPPPSGQGEDESPGPVAHTNGHGPTIKAGAKRMLAALLDAPRPLTRPELATLSKVRTGGTMSDYLSTLRTHSLICEDEGKIRLVDVGLVASEFVGRGPVVRMPQEVVGPHLGDLKAGARRMLDLLMRSPDRGYTRKELSGLAQIATGGTFSDYLSSLRRRGLAEERGRRVYPGGVLYLWEGR